MKQAFRLIAIFTLLLAPFISVSAEVGEDNVDFGTIKVGNSNFNFKCEWIYSGSEKFSSASNRDFILYNGNIYFNDYRNNAKYSFAIIDASTGEFKQTLKLNWPGQASKRFSVFVGRDSNGTPFCTTEGTPSTPFELCTLKFDASGIPSPDKLFTFPLRADWYVRSVDVGGDISSGNFTIYATIWKSDEMNVNKSTDTGLAAWKVTNGNIGAPEFISKNLTITDIEPLDENRFIIVCRGPYNNKNNAGYRVPTLCEWNTITGEWTEYETFPCKMFSKCTNAVERFTLGGKQFLAYWNATGLVTTEAREGSHFGLAYTPDLPTSFNSAQTIIEKFGIGNSSIDYEDVAMWSWKANSSVHTEKISDNAVRIVINDRGGNLRSYTLTTDAPQPPVIKKEEPVFNPASGTQLKKGDKVTVSCEGAIMMLYRLDGASALQYTEPIAVENDCTIEAWGIYSDGEGPHATASYTVEKPIAKVAPTFNPTSGTHLKKDDKVTVSCEGAIMMLYRLDGASAIQYTEPIAVENDCTIEAWGIYSDGEGPHATASYTVEKPIAKVAPTFNPASGTQLKKGDKVTIACEGAIMMLYRLDGASALQYTEPIAVENDCTIEAWGIYSDGEGPHATASYTVEKPIAKVAPTFNPASGTQLKKGDKVTVSCEGAIMMLYRLDDASAIQYTEPIAVENDCSIEAWGIYSDGEGPHATASYTIEKPVPKVAPTFNPASGTQLKKGEKVTIACDGALLIKYRYNNGVTQTYTAPIEPEIDCTIDAWGIFPDGEGPRATAKYSVEKPVVMTAPIFDPVSGTELDRGQKIKLSCKDAMLIMYKIDNGDAMMYESAIKIKDECTVEAWGVFSAGEGPHATAHYTIKKETERHAPVFNPASGSTLKKGESINITCQDATLILYRINNGSITPYLSDPIVIENDCEIEAWGIYPSQDGPHAIAKYYIESEENDCYLATTSHNDIQSGMSVKIGAIHEGNLFAAMPCGVSGLSGGILGELGNNLSHISTTSPTGTFIVDVCNRGGYTIRDEASGEYLRQIANGELTLGDYDNAESFYLNYENRDNLLYTAITNKEGDMTMVYDNEYGHFIFKSEARSNIILYRYAPYGKPEIPNTLYLHRSFSGNWDLSLPVETINTENRKIILDSFYIPKEETADIFIANMKSTGESGGTDWLEITRGIIYIPAENIEYAADGTMVGMIAYPEGHYMGVKPPTAKLGGGYTYSLTVEFGGFSPILHITKTSGTTDIDGISEDEGSPVYYNLQGIQIDNPQPGIYIERRGNKIRKVFIK